MGSLDPTLLDLSSAAQAVWAAPCRIFGTSRKKLAIVWFELSRKNGSTSSTLSVNCSFHVPRRGGASGRYQTRFPGTQKMLRGWNPASFARLARVLGIPRCIPSRSRRVRRCRRDHRRMCRHPLRPLPRLPPRTPKPEVRKMRLTEVVDPPRRSRSKPWNRPQRRGASDSSNGRPAGRNSAEPWPGHFLQFAKAPVPILRTVLGRRLSSHDSFFHWVTWVLFWAYVEGFALPSPPCRQCIY